MQVKIKKLHPDAVIPTYGSHGAACFDISVIDGGIIPDGGFRRFRTGLAFDIPEGYVMKVYSRSGMGFNFGLRLSNGTGVIDSDYTGELLIQVHNDRSDYYNVVEGSRLAQAMLEPVPRVTFVEVDELKHTERGANGLGSTGK